MTVVYSLVDVLSQLHNQTGLVEVLITLTDGDPVTLRGPIDSVRLQLEELSQSIVSERVKSIHVTRSPVGVQ